MIHISTVAVKTKNFFSGRRGNPVAKLWLGTRACCVGCIRCNLEGNGGGDPAEEKKEEASHRQLPNEKPGNPEMCHFSLLLFFKLLRPIHRYCTHHAWFVAPLSFHASGLLLPLSCRMGKKNRKKEGQAQHHKLKGGASTGKGK